MSINITSAENALQLKMNELEEASNFADFVYGMKAIEQLNAIVVTAFDEFADLPSAGSFPGRVAYVTANQLIYFSNGTSWVAFATSQNPDFTTSRLDPIVPTTNDYELITGSATAEIDYGAVSGASPEAVVDLGFDLDTESAGAEGDIYIDPDDWTFTIYDGSTKRGIKHLRADMNNRNFRTMSANNQGIAHLYKNDTTTTAGAPVTIPMTGTRINDTRMGELVSGYYQVIYEGWYEIRMDGHVSGDCWIGFGTEGDYSTSEGPASGGPDPFTMQYVDEQGLFRLERVVYAPIGVTIRPYIFPPNTTSDRSVYGGSSWVADNVNTNFTYLTQMNIRYLGRDTATNDYQV